MRVDEKKFNAFLSFVIEQLGDKQTTKELALQLARQSIIEDPTEEEPED